LNNGGMRQLCKKLHFPSTRIEFSNAPFCRRYALPSSHSVLFAKAHSKSCANTKKRALKNVRRQTTLPLRRTANNPSNPPATTAPPSSATSRTSKKYPQAPERPQIYRALVEACLQLRDTPRAAGYAEHVVALTPEDMSITLLAIQLLEKTAMKPPCAARSITPRASFEYVRNSSDNEKSPRVSPQQWTAEKKAR